MARKRRFSFRNYFGDKLKIGLLAAVLGLALLIFFIGKEAFITAEVEDFYPTTCLGSWQDPEKAQGEPETLKFPEKEINSDNSAYLEKAGGQIYCGQFLAGDYAGEGEIKGVGLTLVWDVLGLPEVVLPAATIPATSPGDLAPEDNSSTPAEEVVDEVKKELDPPVEEMTPPSSLNRFFAPLVLAQTEEPMSTSPATETAGEPKPEPTIETTPTPPLAEPVPEPMAEPSPETIEPPDEEVLVVEELKEKQPENINEGSEPVVVEAMEIASSTGSASGTPITEILFEPPEIVDENFLEISYSLNGQEWIPISKISSQNWFHYTVPLPVVSWDDLRKIQIRIGGVQNTLEIFPDVYLDGMFVEVQYEKPPIVQIFESETIQEPAVQEVELPGDLPLIVIPEGKGLKPAPTDKKDFSPNESPSFDFDLDNLPTGNVIDGETSGVSPPNRISFQNSEVGIMNYELRESEYNGDTIDIQSKYDRRSEVKIVVQGNPQETAVKKPRSLAFFRPGFFGRLFLSFADLKFVNSAKADENAGSGVRVLSEANPVIAQVVDSAGEPTTISPTILTVNNKLRVNVPEPRRSLRPGTYKLKVWVLKDDKVFFSETDFTWGVFAINFSKSVYKSGDMVNAGMAVLDDGGHTICDSQISLRVVLPDGSEQNFSTRNGSIIYSDTCGADNVTEEADYKTDFLVNATGTYNVFATTRTENGLRDFEDKFEVQKEPSFDVLRSGPTRIFPLAEYRVSMKIIPKDDFSGVAKEIVPADFRVVGNVPIDERVIGEDRILIWNLDLKAGETREISYIFKAPNASPEFYKLGPLGFYSNTDDTRPVFSETRAWQIAADAVLNDGSVLAYGDAADDHNMNRRILTSTSTFGGEGTTVDTGGLAADIKHVVIKAAPTRNEFVAGHLDINGALGFVVANNGTWSNLFQVLGSSALQACNGTLGGCDQTFDLAYEQLSGEALMVYGKAANDGIIYYTTWDGNVTSSESSFTFNAGSSVDTNWVRLVPRGDRLTDQRTDEMLFLVEDDNQDIFAAIWDGSSFGSTTTITQNVATSSERAFDGAWETNSGDIVVVYSSGTLSTTPFLFKRFSGGTWDATGTVFSTVSSTQGVWVSMAADPLSNRLSAGITSVGTPGTGQGWPAVWKTDGVTTGWTLGIGDTSLENPVCIGVASGWERFGSGDSTSSAIFSFNDGASNDAPTYETWISGTGFSAIAAIPFAGLNSNWNDDGCTRKFSASPNDDELMWFGVDIDQDLGVRRWDGSAWDANATNIDLNASVGSASNNTFLEANAFDFAYKMYSPWSLNWRWYNGTSTADTPAPDLAAENTSTTISSSSMKLRLRFNVAELGGNSQTDARKKLQWTTSTTPNASSSVWTDVDDISGSGMWRYFDCSGDTVCDDGGVVSEVLLSSSTTAGWWTIDKDAAAGGNMDHASTTVRELEFPIEGNSAEVGFTYYFRMYDVGQQSPVYRQQTSWPATPCASTSACTYPSIVLSNPAPSVSAVSLNGGSPIILTAGATTTVYANFTVSVPTGCADVFSSGNVTSTAYRSGVGGSCTADNLNCYRVATTTNDCSGGTTAKGTSTFLIYYFAQATDASSSFDAQNWLAQVEIRDVSNNSSTATSTAVELATLVAIDVTTSSINYGSMSPSSTTGSANQTISVVNAGNSSSTVKVSGTALTFSSNVISTSSQHYATDSFMFGYSEQALDETATTISGLSLIPKVSTTTGGVDSWSSTAALPGNQYDGMAVVANGYLYNLGGNTSTVAFAKINSKGTLSAWSTTQSLPTTYDQFAAASQGDFIYIPGGSAPVSESGTTTVLYAQVSATGSISAWQEGPALPAAVYDNDAAIARGYLYSVGGDIDDGNNAGTTTVLYAQINADGSLGDWTETTPLPQPQTEHRVATNGDFIYVVSGVIGLLTLGPSTTVQYAPVNSDGTLGSWVETSPLPVKRRDHVVVISGDYIYTYGGDPVNGVGVASTTMAFINSDGTLNAWTQTTVLPSATRWGAGSVYHGYLYSLGGYQGGFSSDVDYAPITNGLSAQDIFWGVGVSAGKPIGSYFGASTFTAVYEP